MPRAKWILIALIVFIWLLIFARVSGAQTLKHDLLTVTLQVGDMVTTNKVISQGGHEANPLMKPFAGGPVKLTTAKSVYTAYQLYAAHSMAKRHPKRARIVWAAVNIWQGYVVYHNMKQVK